MPAASTPSTACVKPGAGTSSRVCQSIGTKARATTFTSIESSATYSLGDPEEASIWEPILSLDESLAEVLIGGLLWNPSDMDSALSRLEPSHFKNDACVIALGRDPPSK
ncbi:uncharacterized protein RAG0_09189 [Rhynchosporium agropyri]|uniref:Uncharacterized protein n=1 Tax=Rhynchosporium agropyri TaxID=914238 RepID=A0A1E1KU60_9HELO|nr:uncharacterized protein RAG0_09189 [Rhynchosporium agropyri]